MQGAWDALADSIGKGDQGHTRPWYRYVTGRLPRYPEAILGLDARHSALRLEAIRGDAGADPAGWDVHHWQDRKPVLCEGLVHTMLGAPMPIYHGGLLHCPVRYFDAEERRPGLPAGVGALVESVSAGTLRVPLVNADPLRSRTLVVQGGAFGEHALARATDLDTGASSDGPGGSVLVELGPAAGGHASGAHRAAVRAATCPRDTVERWGAARAAAPGHRGRLTGGRFAVLQTSVADAWSAASGDHPHRAPAESPGHAGGSDPPAAFSAWTRTFGRQRGRSAPAAAARFAAEVPRGVNADLLGGVTAAPLVAWTPVLGEDAPHSRRGQTGPRRP